MSWISTKERLPKPYTIIAMSYISTAGYRHYYAEKVYPYMLRNGKLFFGDREVDYWQQLEELPDPDGKTE